MAKQQSQDRWRNRLVSTQRLERPIDRNVEEATVFQRRNPEILQAANYNEEMFVVRYLALAALAVWVGGLMLILMRTTGGDPSGQFFPVAAACGAIIIACFFVMKFMGPPPHAFVVRAGIVFAMTALTVYARVYTHSALLTPMLTTLLTPLLTPRSVATVNVALGFILLAWYARE